MMHNVKDMFKQLQYREILHKNVVIIQTQPEVRLIIIDLSR